MIDPEKHYGKFHFLKVLKSEFLSTISLYRNILRNPLLLLLGTYQVCKDIFYELPKSIFSAKKIYKNLQHHLDESASQCITISEIVTIPGNFIGFILLQMLGANNFIASIVGANVGDYFSSVFSYTLFYIVLTRGHGSAYPTKKAFIDCIEVIKDCLPAALVLYITEAPFIAALLIIGLSPIMAISLNLIVAMTIYIGVAKYSATKHIESRFS